MSEAARTVLPLPQTPHPAVQGISKCSTIWQSPQGFSCLITCTDKLSELEPSTTKSTGKLGEAAIELSELQRPEPAAGDRWVMRVAVVMMQVGEAPIHVGGTVSVPIHVWGV